MTASLPSMVMPQVTPAMFSLEPTGWKNGSPSLESTVFPSPKPFDIRDYQFKPLEPPGWKNGSPSLESTVFPSPKPFNVNDCFKPVELPWKKYGSPSSPSTLKSPKPLDIMDYLKRVEIQCKECIDYLPKPKNPILDTINQKKYSAWEGNAWSKSLEPTRVYGKNLPQYGKYTQLHIHETQDGFITGANRKHTITDETFPISNYEAAMEDLTPTKSFFEKIKGFLGW